MSETPPEVVDTGVVDAEVVERTHRGRSTDLGMEIPDNPDEAIAMLIAKLVESRDEASSYLDDLRRVAADFDNYRKRTMREQATIMDRAAERVVRELLPVLDSLDAAVAVEVSTDSERQLIAGMFKTRELLLDSLRKEGLELIETIGEPFDPEVHEAVGFAGGSATPLVEAELRRGYKLAGRVLRAALVTLESPDEP